MNDPVPSPTAAPPPEPTFDVLALSSDIRKAVDSMGYLHPTPVQRAVFEPAIAGRSLVVQARTGTGKTAAFGLPIVDRIVRVSLKRVQAMVLCPTRELALQVGREIDQLGKFREVRVAAIYGGASMSKQIDELSAGAQIVVGTPGRVLDHLRQGTLDPSEIRVLVLDEADEMLSMGFAKELNAILENLPKTRQGLFFSATLPPDIQRLAQAHLREPELITLSSDQVGALEIDHYVYTIRDGDKLGHLVRILEVEDPESAIIFCNTRDETLRVAEGLKSRGFDADWLNGDLPQSDRERVMSATREGRLRFLVATDVAARGIDVSHLTHVINYDFPDTAEQYVHRTGRTGRAGRTGTAIALVGPKDIGNVYLLRLTYKIRPIEKQLPTQGELKTRAELDVVQLFADAFATQKVHVDDLSLARRLLTHQDAERIVGGLLRDHLGARGADASGEASEARRARNPRVEPPQAPKPAQPAPLAAGAPQGAARNGTPPARARTEARRPREAVRPSTAVPISPAPASVAPGAPVLPVSPMPSAAPVSHPSPVSPATVTSRGSWEPPREPDDDKPILGRDAHESPAPAPSAPTAAAPTDSTDEAFVQLFVNVGSRDGLHATDFQKLLNDAGIGAEDTGGIRVRDRMTFVGVRKASVERAVGALSGHVIGGRKVFAEPARSR